MIAIHLAPEPLIVVHLILLIDITQTLLDYQISQLQAARQDFCAIHDHKW